MSPIHFCRESPCPTCTGRPPAVLSFAADSPPPCCGVPQLGPVPGIGYYCHLGWQCAAPSPFTPEPTPSPALAIYAVMRKHGILNRIIRVAGEEDRYETDAEALDRHLTDD